MVALRGGEKAPSPARRPVCTWVTRDNTGPPDPCPTVRPPLNGPPPPLRDLDSPLHEPPRDRRPQAPPARVRGRAWRLLGACLAVYAASSTATPRPRRMRRPPPASQLAASWTSAGCRSSTPPLDVVIDDWDGSNALLAGGMPGFTARRRRLCATPNGPIARRDRSWRIARSCAVDRTPRCCHPLMPRFSGVRSANRSHRTPTVYAAHTVR